MHFIACTRHWINFLCVWYVQLISNCDQLKHKLNSHDSDINHVLDDIDIAHSSLSLICVVTYLSEPMNHDAIWTYLDIYGVGAIYATSCKFCHKIDAGGNKKLHHCYAIPDIKVHGANMRPTWVLSAPDRLQVDPMNHAIWDVFI